MKSGKKRWAALQFRQKIRNILLVYYLTPILLVLLGMGTLFYGSAKSALDEELGHRLTAIAASAASHVRNYQVNALGLGDRQSLTYQALLEKLNTIRKATGVAKIYIFDDQNRSLLDTDPSITPGTTYERNLLHLSEIEQVQKGHAVSSVLFKGDDDQYYKSAFAPIATSDGPKAFVGVDGSATFFANLTNLSRRLLYFAIACLVIVALITILIARKIVNPVAHLVEAARRIGEGYIDQPVRIETKNEIGFLGFVLDEMRKNILHRDRERQMMLRGIAHEVRNPLGGIELFAGMLSEEMKDKEAHDAVVRIQNEVKTLKRLVEEFLDFARGPSLQPSATQLQGFLEDIRFAFQTEFDERQIDFNVNADGVKEVEFDSDQMRRVFLNLVQNAIHAVSKNGKIDIQASTSNGQVEISVMDTGPGIPEDRLDKIFDPFYTTKDKGTGLGLSFVRKIVNAHGGEVRVETALNQGTKMTVVLPLA